MSATSHVQDHILASPSNRPVPRPLGYADVPAAVNTSLEALDGDPLQRYLLETPDRRDTVLHRTSRWSEFAIFWTSIVNKGNTYTIDDGKAVLGFTSAKESHPRSHLSNAYDLIAPYTFVYKRYLFSKEQGIRSKEVGAKIKAATEKVIGSRKDSVIYLDIVMTAKAAQGKGYGSALIKLALEHADKEKRTIWLISSNVINTGFYESFGFVSKEDVVVGDENPTWTESPVIVRVMVREYSETVQAVPHL